MLDPLAPWLSPASRAATLRRWAVAGRIHRTREGRTHYESLYVKGAGVWSK